MRAFWKGFFLRGLVAAGFGPLVLVGIYAILGATGAVTQFTPREVCLGILSVTVLAFLVGGMNAIYQLEALPLFWAITIHGGVLYLMYIFVYLINGWLQQQLVAVGVFTAIFAVGYALIWAVIFATTRASIRKLNAKMKKGSN